MIHMLAQLYSHFLCNNHIISEEDCEIHEYGFTALIVFVCNYGMLFLLAALTGTMIETVIFLLTYSIPRNIIGGWHAETPLLCSICGIIMWAVVMILYHHLHLPETLLLVLSIACAATLLFLVSKKDITEKRKKLGFLIIVVLCITSIIFALYGLKSSSLILYALLCNTLMNIPKHS